MDVLNEVVLSVKLANNSTIILYSKEGSIGKIYINFVDTAF